jgi:signal transduction histidine kinase
MVVIGLVVGLFYTLALGLFFQSRMYERTYLTFFLIVQTIYYLGFMTIGRFAYGINYGMASRYTCVSIYGLVALAWIFIFTLTRSVRTTALLKAVFYSGFAMIFVGLLLTAVVEWRIQPFRKIYFKQLHAIALRVDTATPEELSKFEERPKLVRDSLRLLREYRLNVYRTLPGGQGITPLHAHRTSLMSKTIASKE